MRATFKFVDNQNNSNVAVLTGLDASDASAMTKLKTAAGSLQAMCNAGITEIKTVAYETQATPTLKTPLANDYSSTLHKGILNFSYTENDEQKNYRLIIPAPELARWEQVAVQGYRLTAVAGGALQTALRTATGITDLQFVEGYLEYWGGKATKPEAPYIKMYDGERVQYMSVPQVTDLAALAAFAGVLRGTTVYTNAGITEVGFATVTIEVIDPAPTPAVEEGFDSAPEQSGTLVFSYVDGAVKKFQTLSLPTLMADKFETTKDKKGRDKDTVKAAVGALVASTLRTVYGSTVRPLVFVRGQRNLKK